MTPEQWQQVREAYEAATATPPDHRAVVLAEFCGNDEEVRAQVERLLSARPHASNYLETPPFVEAAWLQAATDSAIGRCIGLYQIVREIGAGGMSTVYLAVRADDEYKKEVAIKLVWPGLQSAEIVRRFRQERQILANLEHPHIARLLDGGTTDDGWPYLVMEYVDGQPLTAYCDEHELPVKDRLRLFGDVCAAVEYAHQQAVVHRDLKPNNILVTPAVNGEVGIVKLLDFGIAKLLKPDPHATAATTVWRALTPDYASPEQIRGEEAAPANDVYSLGVLLYELLTGVRPYRLNSPLPHEISKAICEVEPSPPSRCVITLARSQPSFRAAETEKLRRQLKGDLDNIVLTALAKEPAQRYPTPAALAADIERHLAGRPVLARGNHWLYRLSKQARRYPVLTTALLLTWLGGMAWLSWWIVTAPARQLAARHARYASAIEQATLAWQMNRMEDCAQSLQTCLPARGEADLRGFEWNYLWRASHQAQLALPYTTGVADAHFACHGQRILTEAPWSSYWLWDVATGKLLDAWRAEQGSVDTVPYEPDVLISVDARGTFWRRNLCTSERTRLFTDTLGQVSYRKSFPGQPEIAIGHTDGTIALWSPEQEQPFKVLRGAPGIIERIRTARGGHRMLTQVGADLIQLWDVAAGRVLAAYRQQAASAMNFSPDGRFFWTLADLRRPTVRESATGRTVAVAAELNHKLNGMALLRADVLAVSGYETLTLFSFPALKKLFELKARGSGFLGVQLSPDESLLAATTMEGRLLLWDFATRRLLADVKGHNTGAGHFNFSADGRKLITAGEDGQAKVWDVAQLLAPPKLEGHQDSVVSVTFSPDGRQLASASFDRTVKLWDVPTGKLLRTFTGHTDLVLCVVFSPDGRQLAASDNDGLVLLWEVNSGQPPRRFQHPRQTHAVAFAPDGQWLATACSDNNVRLWNLRTNQPPRLFSGHQDIVVSVNFSPDGHKLVSGSWDKTAKLWDVATGRVLRTLTGHSGWVWSAVFSPDGQRLATSSTDRTAKLWDVATGQVLRDFTGHRDEIFEVAFSPDGRRLATASEDRTVRIWDTATGRELLTIDDHTDEVWSVAFSPDGNTLASASWDKTIRLWRAAKVEEVKSETAVR